MQVLGQDNYKTKQKQVWIHIVPFSQNVWKEQFCFKNENTWRSSYLLKSQTTVLILIKSAPEQKLSTVGGQFLRAHQFCEKNS